jgi:hypothetical protein
MAKKPTITRRKSIGTQVYPRVTALDVLRSEHRDWDKSTADREWRRLTAQEKLVIYSEL